MSATTDTKTEFPVTIALGGGRRQEGRIGRNTTWEQFRQRVHLAYGLPAGAVTYTDEEGDKISLDSEAEFKEAVKVGFKLGRLKLNIKDSKACIKRQSKRGGHYSELARTIGEEKKESAQTRPVVGNTGSKTTDPPSPNPYITSFEEGMSLEGTKTKSGSERAELMDTSSHQPPPSQASQLRTRANRPLSRAHHSPSQGVEETAAKRCRVTNHAATATSSSQQVEGVVRDLESMKISPTADNPYVEKLAQALLECYARKMREPLKCASSTPNLSDTRPFNNQYVTHYQQRVQKTQCVCQPCQPNRYVAHLEHRLSKNKRCKSTQQKVTPPTVNEKMSESTPNLPAGTGPVHCGVRCDGCGSQITGVRYKCGNCGNYDLCEECEKRSDLIHSPDHIFLKVRVPCLWLGQDTRGYMRPLLPYVAYSDLEMSEDQVPLLQSEEGGRVGGGGGGGGGGGPLIVRPKDKLREEIKAAKRRRKEERRRYKAEQRSGRYGGGESVDPRKLRARLEKLQIRSHDRADDEKKTEFVLPPVTFETTKAAAPGDHPHRPAKYLGCKMETESCCPQGSSVPCGVNFEKGWILKNTGTKKWKKTRLVHQGGYKPYQNEVSVPEVMPGESTEVRVQYPAVNSGDDIQIIESTWSLVYKESTAFGPLLTVSVVVEAPPLKTTPPVLPPPSSSTTNEDLLRSIGFLPTDCPNPTPSEKLPTDFELISPTAVEPGEILTGEVPQEGGSGVPAFVMVENPCSEVMSLASNDSLHQTASAPTHADSDGDSDGESVASDDGSHSEDDFVVVIPDCFNLDLPLSSRQPHHVTPDDDNTRCTSRDKTDDVMLQSHDLLPSNQQSLSNPPEDSTASVPNPVPIPPQVSVPLPHNSEPKQQQAPPTSATPPTSTATAGGGACPQTGRRPFVPSRVTLREVKDARLTNPLTVATGFVNTVSNLVEGLNLRGKKKEKTEKDGRKEDAKEQEEDDEMFVDCPEPSAPSMEQPSGDDGDTTSFTSWQQCLPSTGSWLQQAVSQFVGSDSQNDQVREMVERQWRSNQPEDPMDKLVAMGFANRELNKQLLEKHNNQLQAVTNELLDLQHNGHGHWASTRH